MANHPFGTVAYGVASIAGAPQRTRDAALLVGGLADDVAVGGVARNGPVRRRPASPHGQIASPTLGREQIRLSDLNANGQATGVTATITADMLGTGRRASRKIIPAGYV